MRHPVTKTHSKCLQNKKQRAINLLPDAYGSKHRIRIAQAKTVNELFATHATKCKKRCNEMSQYDMYHNTYYGPAGICDVI